ncbi:11036_t:CDS:2 [Ambispora gerdemannii]|uniref:11036_t:CDS:1 n=1 Tax=Ambispora gerdemannii TaxID=144530 RepID=A0A9N9DM37_9GLOM|nr:11036_t:CDS:2 [Ambispora gerdemannii]
MVRVLAIDPSGTGTSGIYFKNGEKEEFKEWALECLPVQQVNSVNVLKVKELTKQLLKGVKKLEGLEYKVGRGKG